MTSGASSEGVSTGPGGAGVSSAGGTSHHGVALVVDRAFGDRLNALATRLHVWVIDTPTNKAAVETIRRETSAAPSLERGATTFAADADARPEGIVASMLASIDLHHGQDGHSPPWSFLEVYGAPLTPTLIAALAQFGFRKMYGIPDGFQAWRSVVRAGSSRDLGWMIGGQVTKVELLEPVSWWFAFLGGGALRADSLWRIVSDGRIQVTSEDHDQEFGLPKPVDAAARAASLLAKRLVSAASIREDTGDVVLEFDDHSRLEVLTTSSGCESWAIFSPNGDEAIGCGGGRVELWKRDGQSPRAPAGRSPRVSDRP